MVDSARYIDFVNDKKDFYSRVQSTNDANTRATAKNYSFLAKNQLAIEQEFNQLFAALKTQGKNRKEFWLYCYYCCTLLENYYIAYDKQDKVAFYSHQGEKLKKCYETGIFPKESIDTLQKRIAADLGTLVSTPKHSSKIRDWVGFVNIYRIHFVFCRLSVRQSLLLARELEWLKTLEQLFGMQVNVDGMVSMINAPTPVFNVLSVGLFAARFIINAGTLLKHTFSMEKEESSILKTERFYQELAIRHCTMLNDVGWGSVNLLCNYAPLFNISAATAGWLTAGFMIFDISLLLYRRYLSEQDYLFKKDQYLTEKRNYETLLAANPAKNKSYCDMLDMLDDQLAQLEISWKATSATAYFNVAAALLLMAGFSASMIFVMPAAIVANYFVCTLGVAMYLTADLYGKYKENALVLELHERKEMDTAVARFNMETARSEFMMAMAKTIIMPLLIVTTFAICWQAALLLTAVYIGYESVRGYAKATPSEDDASPLILHGQANCC